MGQPVHDEPGSAKRFDRLTGGRLTYKTPLDGLQFMASGFGSQVRNIVSNTRSVKRVRVFSADYATGNLDLKAERGAVGVFGVKGSTYYLQAGYTLADKWTPFVRYDYITTDNARKSDPAFYQKTASVGLTYKFRNDAGVRLENHFNRGYALPVAAGNVAAGQGKARWNMLGASLFFVF